MALLGASGVAVTPERSPPGAAVAMPWAGSPGLRERPVVAMGKAGGEDASKGDNESIRRAGARAQAAEVGAWGATALAGEVVSASLVQGEGAFSAGKERSSEANRGDCSAKAEGRAAHAREVAASADAAGHDGPSPRPNSAFATASREVSTAVTVRVELRLTPSWVTVRRERRDTA